MISKPKRTVNKDLLKNITKLPCLICKKNPPSDPHHMTTRGAGGGDTIGNVIPLCRPHHQEFHSLGRKRFMYKYDAIQKWAEEMLREDLL